MHAALPVRGKLGCRYKPTIEGGSVNLDSSKMVYVVEEGRMRM